MSEKVEHRPFHETIIDAVNTCENIHELEGLASLVKATKIPKNHDEIISILQTAINYWKHEIEKESDIKYFTDVLDDLHKQKREVEAEKQMHNAHTAERLTRP
jgi:hypothetical protein